MEKLAFCEEIYSSESQAAIQRLSVLTTTDSLCLFMYDGNFKLLSIQLAKNIKLSQKKVIFQELSKLQDLHSTVLYYSTCCFTLMPRKLFLYGKEKSYLSNVCHVNNKDVVFTDQCDAEQIINVYAIPVLEDFAIRQAIDGVRTKHIFSEFIRNTKLESQRAYVYLFQNHMHIFYNGDLLPNLVSIVHYKQWEDVLYKIQEIQSHYKLMDNQFVLCGNLDKTDEIYFKIQEKKPGITIFSDKREINLSFIVKA